MSFNFWVQMMFTHILYCFPVLHYLIFSFLLMQISSDPRLGMSTCVLPDELVVDILSRLPLKSLCRFKCVCKAWLAFASDPHYQWKLPKIPTGLFHGRKDSSVAQIVSLSPNDEEINGALTFLPRHEHLEFVDCCNGLILCNYKSSYTYPEACRFIVCNPATQEWRSP